MNVHYCTEAIDVPHYWGIEGGESKTLVFGHLFWIYFLFFILLYTQRIFIMILMKKHTCHFVNGFCEECYDPCPSCEGGGFISSDSSNDGEEVCSCSQQGHG